MVFANAGQARNNDLYREKAGYYNPAFGNNFLKTILLHPVCILQDLQ